VEKGQSVDFASGTSLGLLHDPSAGFPLRDRLGRLKMFSI
jgi:hypothetical protein